MKALALNVNMLYIDPCMLVHDSAMSCNLLQLIFKSNSI